MTDNTQPEAGSTHIIRFALELGLLWIDGSGRDKVREALDALDALEAQLEAIGAGGVSGPLVGCAPEGMVMVPKEPTHHMLYAAASAYKDARQSLGAYNAPRAAYRAMLEVAPNPPTSAEGRSMGESQSLADTFVETLAAVRAMDNGIGLEHPERHVIRDLKRNAEALIADALRRARELAYTAESIRELRIQRESDPS